MYAILMWFVQTVVRTVLSIIPKSSKIRHGKKVTNPKDQLVEYDGMIVGVLKWVQKGMLWILPLCVILLIIGELCGGVDEADKKLTNIILIFYVVMLIIITLYGRKYENTYFIFGEKELLWCYGYGKRVVPYEEIKQEMRKRYFKVNNSYIIPVKHTSIRIKSQQATGLDDGMKKMKKWGIKVPYVTEKQKKRFNQINYLKLGITWPLILWFAVIGIELLYGNELTDRQEIINWALPGIALVCLILFLTLNHILTERIVLKGTDNIKSN